VIPHDHDAGTNFVPTPPAGFFEEVFLRRKKREKKEGRREERGGRGKGENKKCTAVVAALTGVLPPCPTPAMLRRRFR